jgi:hypothetical protein
MKVSQILALLSAIMLSAITAHASEFKVSGRVAAKSGVPEMYATVRVFNEQDTIKPVVYCATDTAGVFSLTLPDAGKYNLSVSATGREPLTRTFEVSTGNPSANLGTITLGEEAVNLDEVTVTAMRPLVKREIDRLSYDVKADPEAGSSNLREILRKVPMLTVDADGTIRINGQTNFKIYKNGRPNNAYSNNAKELFAAIPASSIKKIEVITAPGVRDDAEGSTTILNIVTDSQTALKGVLGQIGVSYYSVSNAPLLDAYLTSQIDRVTFNFYGNYGYFPRSRATKGHEETTVDYYDSGNRQHSRSEYSSVNSRGFYGVEASWEPDTLRLLTLEASGWNQNITDAKQREVVSLTGPDNTLLQQYTMIPDPAIRNRGFTFDGAVNYQRMTRRPDETITLSYNLSASSRNNMHDNRYSDLTGWTLPYTEIIASSRTYYTEQTLQADWTRPYFQKITLDLGAKAIFRRNHAISANDYVNAYATSDDFIHHTTVSGAYADLRGKFGKWMIRGGIRYEYSYLSAKFLDRSGYDEENRPDFHRDIHDWVPTASVMYAPSDAHYVKAAYQRSIQRPGISYLNPAVTVTPLTVSFGNPDLESAANNKISLEYMYMGPKINCMLYVWHSFNNNGIGPVQWVGADGKTRYSTYANIGKTREFGVSPWLGGMIGAKTRINLGFNFGWERHQQPTPVSGDAVMVTVSGSHWWCNPYWYIQQQLPWKLSLSFNGSYWSGNQENAYSYESRNFWDNLYYSFSLSRAFLKDDRLNVMISAQNPFGPTGNDTYTHTSTPDYTREVHSWHSASRGFSIRVSWRFGSLKASVRKANRTISNDDVVGGGDKK